MVAPAQFMTPAARIPSLDGWRAIAILIVVFSHLVGTHGFPLDTGPVADFVSRTGHLGVVIFFVISGLLITTLLMHEQASTGSISLKKFYARRALRILPASYAYVLAIALASWLGWLTISRLDIALALEYLTNYNAARSWFVGHLWSLSVEEQFYLLWPFVLVWLGRRHGFFAALVAFLVAPAVRLGLHLAFSHGPYRDLEIFPAVADGLAAGCLMALARPWLLQQPWYLRVTQASALWLVLPLAVVVHHFGGGYTIVDVFGTPPMLVGLAVLIEASTRRADRLSARILNSAPMVLIGTLSYSLYLWQQPFMQHHVAHLTSTFPINLVLIAIAAGASYLLIERPFLRMRWRFSPSPRREAASGPVAPAPVGEQKDPV